MSQCRGWLRATGLPHDLRHGWHRALRLRRWHLGAHDRLGSASDRRATRSCRITPIARASASTCSAIRTSTANTPTGPCSTRSATPMRMLARAEDAPDRADLGRNGSYLVLRQLKQDVAVSGASSTSRCKATPFARKQLAEAMVGRTMEGEPLMGHPRRNHRRRERPAQHLHLPQRHRRPALPHRRAHPAQQSAQRRPAAGRARLHFMGGAHLGLRRRGACQRSGLVDPLPSALASRTRVRHGVGEQALAAPPTRKSTGLHFICLGANIARQFEFVQSRVAGGRAIRRLARRKRSAASATICRARTARHRQLLDADRLRPRPRGCPACRSS